MHGKVQIRTVFSEAMNEKLHEIASRFLSHRLLKRRGHKEFW